jgi:hypothetical protein
MDLKEVVCGGVDWSHLIRDWVQWLALRNKVANFGVRLKSREFLDSRATNRFKRTLLHRIKWLKSPGELHFNTCILPPPPPQGPTIVCMGSGTPRYPSYPVYSWVTLSPGAINTETWSSRLGVGRGANNPTP